MVPLFAGYALLVWFPACIHRRRWLGLTWLIAGSLGLIAMAVGHLLLSRATGNQIFAPVFQGIFYPYIGLVAGMGLYLFLLPRSYPSGACMRCGYDLSGAPDAHRVCPECGREIPIPTDAGRCRACGQCLVGRPGTGRCTSCRTAYVHPAQHKSVREAQLQRWVIEPRDAACGTEPESSSPNQAEDHAQQHDQDRRHDDHRPTDPNHLAR